MERNEKKAPKEGGRIPGALNRLTVRWEHTHLSSEPNIAFYELNVKIIDKKKSIE